MFAQPEKKPATDHDFAATGKVSVWVGDFDDETALLDYIEAADGLGADFGCVLLHRRELTVEALPKPLRELLHGFSYCKNFVDAIVAPTGEKVWARCAVVSYASDYTLLGITPKPNTCLKFIGVASF